VSKVALISPPIKTVAIGRCTSAPQASSTTALAAIRKRVSVERDNAVGDQGQQTRCGLEHGHRRRSSLRSHSAVAALRTWPELLLA